MTTHKYPADLPADRAQAIDDELARIRHILTQPHVSAGAWEARALAAERDLHAERTAHEETKRRTCDTDEAIKQRVYDVAAAQAQIEQLRAALLAAVAEAERANARADERGATNG